MSRCVEELERVVTGWQPIDTAPKASADIDDELINVLVYEPGGIFYVAAWDERHGMWMDPGLPNNAEEQHENNPTHWMPLPEPPKE